MRKRTDTRHESLYPPSSSQTPNLLVVSDSSLSNETSVKAQVEALLDTGNLAGGFISEKIRPNLDGLIIQCTVCSGLDNSCYSVNIKLVLRFTYYYEILNKNDTFDIDANIFKEAPIDIII